MSRQSLTVVVLLVLAVCAGGVFLLGSGEPVMAPPQFDLAEEDTGDAEPWNPEDASEDLDPNAIAPEAVTRTEAELEEEDDDDTLRTLALQVWDKKKGVPAPDATVFVVDASARRELDWGKTRGDFAVHWSELAPQNGRRFTTDEQGKVTVPMVRGSAMVAASMPGSYGYRWIRFRRRPQPEGAEAEIRTEEVTLKPDELVAVQVVDAAGKPVKDVPVGIVEHIALEQELEQLTARSERMQQRMERFQQWRERAGNDFQMSDEMRERMREARGDMWRLRGQLRTAQRHAERAQSGLFVAAEHATRTEVRIRRRTNDEGIAMFSHFQLYREGLNRWGRGRGRDRDRDNNRNRRNGEENKRPDPFYMATVLTPLPEPVAAPFPTKTLPEDVIQLTMPATGTLVLRTVDRDGRPYTHPVEGELMIPGNDPGRWTRLELRKEQNESAIVFEHVALGMSLEARCRLEDRDFRWTSEPMAGPMQPGQTLTADLVVAPEIPMLYGRLLDSEGTALAGVSPTFLINASTGRLEGEEVTTDQNGRFHLPYRKRESQKGPFSLEIRQRRERDRGEESEEQSPPIIGFASQLRGLPETGITDLGDLKLDAFGAIAQGVVVDDSGAPLRRAQIQLQRERPGGRDGQLRFRDEAFVEATSDENGNFALFGALEAGRYRLRVERRNHFREEVLLNPRGGPMRIEMLRRCRVIGTLVLPEWMERDRVRVTLTPVDVPSEPSGGGPFGAGEPRTEEPRNFRRQAQAFFDWVRPGRYNLGFKLQGFPDEFFKVESLVVQPGQTRVHPRLQDIDLGLHLFRFEVHAVDQYGQPLEVQDTQLARITKPDGSQQFLGMRMRGSAGELFSTTPQIEVFPQQEGYLAEPQMLGAGRSDLVFKELPAVEILLPGLAAMAGEVPVQILLERQRQEGIPDRLEGFDDVSRRASRGYRWSRYASGRIAQGDLASLKVMGSGTYQVSLVFGEWRMRPDRQALEPLEIEIQPGGASPRYSLKFDAQQAQQAIASMRQKIQERANRQSERNR